MAYKRSKSKKSVRRRSKSKKSVRRHSKSKKSVRRPSKCKKSHCKKKKSYAKVKTISRAAMYDRYLKHKCSLKRIPVHLKTKCKNLKKRSKSRK